MCGIVGYLQLQGDGDPRLPRLIETAGDRLAHRGPDGAGLYVSPDARCVLAARRLAIVDRSEAGNQPMANEDGSLWLVFNGEIYNHRTLRAGLVAMGHRFHSASDGEVILHLYEEHGPAVVQHLDGMFSFVIYDATRRRLFGGRDRLGLKPLFYALSPRRFAFASEPKALFALPDVGRAPRVEEVPSYLVFNCVPGPLTLFRDIDKLEAGTVFEVSAEKGFCRKRFWCPGSVANADGADPGRYAARLDEVFRRAIAKRVGADVPVGAMLSGGLDSSLTVAVMTEFAGAPVPTFTIGYPGDESTPDSDLSRARLVAQRLGTVHHEVIIDDHAFAGILEDLPRLADDPIGTPSGAAILHLARHARSCGIPVLLVGEGADEVFCGYRDAYRLWRWHERLKGLRPLLPRPVARALARAARRAVAGTGQAPVRFAGLLEKLGRYGRREPLYWGHGLFFSTMDLEYVSAPRRLPADLCRPLRARLAEMEGFHRRSYLDQLAIIDLLLELPERLLMRLDRGTMLYGVEARAPFLDPAVLEIAFGIPPGLRAPTPKALLRILARQRLPAAVLARAKIGFPAPQRVFMAPWVLARIRESLLARRFLDCAGLDGRRVTELLMACERGSRFFPHVWSLYVLSLWFHRWVEGDGEG